jgi:hypothetical protein
MRLKIAALFLPAVLVAACSSGPPIKPGADIDAAGPHYSAAAAPEVVVPEESAAGPSAAVPTAAATPSLTPLERLRAGIVNALAAEDAIAGASLTIEQRQSADGQLVFKWTSSNNPEDETAPAGLRAQSLAILQQAHLSGGLAFGSVLLIASAMVFDASGRKTEVIAVRAKYSRALVLTTDFTTVSQASVFQLTDDKPAELDPHFK